MEGPMRHSENAIDASIVIWRDIRISNILLLPFFPTWLAWTLTRGKLRSWANNTAKPSSCEVMIEIIYIVGAFHVEVLRT